MIYCNLSDGSKGLDIKGTESREMNTEITDRDAKLIIAMAIIMIPLVIDATIRLAELGRMIG